MIKLYKSVAFRLAAICGVFVISVMAVLSTVFYLGTIREMQRDVDRKLASITERLVDHYEAKGFDALQQEIQTNLTDRFDVDTEIYFLGTEDGRKIMGNLSDGNGLTEVFDQFIDRQVVRDGIPSSARLIVHKLQKGIILAIGYDMKDLHGIAKLIWRTIGIGSAIALALAVGGTIVFRHLFERRVGSIRRTIEEIEMGSLAMRIPLAGVGDEFDHLSDEMNCMFDRIEQLMEGVRHVSNTIAHNLRTPLGRVRGHLDEALRAENRTAQLAKAAEFSMEQIDSLISVFDKLLQIAESESGTRRQPFKAVALREVVTDVVELYDANAELEGITLTADIEGDPKILGDRDLLASVLANLVDNALKYGARTVVVSVREILEAGAVSLVVKDDGPGIPPEDRPNVIQRFYRLDQSVPGTGLGLSIVTAIAHLHGTVLRLEDASPGLLARITFHLIPPTESLMQT